MQNIFWTEIKSPDFSSNPGETIVIVPIGSTEQHGPHLPVAVDSMLAAEVARRTAAIVTPQTPIHVLPALWISLAEHHMNFAGTLTLDYDTFSSVLRCITRSLARQGFTRILLLNGHGGNIAALTVIVNEVSRELNVPLACLTYWETAQAGFAEILDRQPNLRHACEAETSMMMALAPELVDAAKAQTVEAPADGLAPVGGIHRWRAMEEWSASGVVGVPAAATADKGSRLFDAAAEAIAAKLMDGSIWKPVLPKPIAAA